LPSVRIQTKCTAPTAASTFARRELLAFQHCKQQLLGCGNTEDQLMQLDNGDLHDNELVVIVEAESIETATENIADDGGCMCTN
jgi:hypothetical protein